MIRKRIVGFLLALAALSLLAACGAEVSPTPPASPPPTNEPTDTPPPIPTPEPSELPFAFQEGFEGTLEGWQRGADVPDDPERPGQPVEWSIELSADQVATGQSSARFTLDGKQDDGTIWLARPFDVAADEALRVRLTFDLWSASESFNTLAKVAAYAGSQPPGQESDFELGQPANQTEGWRTYEYVFDVRSGSEGRIWVAFGISAVWETEMTYYVDDVRIEAAPAEEGQPPGDRITVDGVEVNEAQVAVRGTSTLPDDACVSTELWADGAPLLWWLTDACAPVKQGAWELIVPLEQEQALQPGVQYMVRAYQPGGPNIVSTFPFDLDGPPMPPSPGPGDDVLLLLPESAEPLHQVSADLNGDGTQERVVLTGWGGGANQLGYDFLQLFVFASAEGDGALIAWQSEQLPTDRAEPLQAADINADGLPEVLSVQAMGASGETLYVLAWQDSAYGWLTPRGGHFDGGESFGENGVRVEDVDDDGVAEILASYGPAAAQIDVYGWNGQAYAYRETLSGSCNSFQCDDAEGESVLALALPVLPTHKERLGEDPTIPSR
ncbi:MAG: hypothetical protein PVI59_13525 [Anaerolineae bacterium]|jgi:hypothetical protein